MTTIQVGNSIQQQAAPDVDSEIQQHTIQEEGYKDINNAYLPDLDIILSGDVMNKIKDQAYELLTYINDNYRLSEDALETLKHQGIMAMFQEIEKEQEEWDSETHMPNWAKWIPVVGLLGDIIDKSVNDGWTKTQARTGTEIGLDTLINMITTAVQGWVFKDWRFAGAMGIISEVIDVIKYALSKPSIEHGQSVIDGWYNSTSRPNQMIRRGNIKIYY